MTTAIGKRASAWTSLGQWCRERIEEAALPTLSSQDNASEIARYFPVEDDDGQEGAGDTSDQRKQSVTITQPVQSTRAPARNRVRKGRVRSKVIKPDNGSGERNKDANRENNKDKTKPRPRPIVESTTAFANPRFRQGNRSDTHSVVASFDNPEETLLNIQLVAVGEDGQDVPVGIREAFVNGKPLTVIDGRIQRISDNASERMSIEFTTREPIPDKTFYLKGDAELK